MAAQYNSAASGQGGYAVTPHDTNLLSRKCRALYVGSVGNVTVDTLDGDVDVLFTAVPTGTVLPICCKRVKSTGTTASAIVAIT